MAAHVLILDDDELFAELVVEWTRLELGDAVHCTVAATMQEALALVPAARPPFDAVVLDLNLPGTSGPATLDTFLEAVPGAPPILVMTGDPDPELEAVITAHGVAFTCKDRLDADRFGALLRQLLQIPALPDALAHERATHIRLAGLEAGQRELQRAVQESGNARLGLVVNTIIGPEQARILFTYSPYAILLVELAPDGGILLANPEAEFLFGYHHSELVGHPVSFLIPERFRDVHREHRRRFARHPKHRPMGTGFPLVALHKSGEEIPVYITLTPVMLPQGGQVLVTVRLVEDEHQPPRGGPTHAVAERHADRAGLGDQPEYLPVHHPAQQEQRPGSDPSAPGHGGAAD